MIEFQNTSVSFRQKGSVLSAVQDITFSIGEGEIFGIAGSSGAGKSTLLRTVNLLQPVTGGNVLVNGEAIAGYRGKRLREHRRGIGMIFQHFNLAGNLTVAQNIAFPLRAGGLGKKETARRVEEYLSLVNLSEKADVYPGRLSGGQKQRVAIARALAGGAKILLCDEPTSALDAESTAAILALLRSLNEELGITIVLITHELEVIKSICGRCAVMDGGRLVEVGGVYELFAEPQQDYTKQLVGHTQEIDLPDQLTGLPGGIIKLTFQGEKANDPVVSDCALRYGVCFNILAGRVEYIGGEPLGVLYLNPVGAAKALEEALTYLREHVKKVEVIVYAGV